MSGITGGTVRYLKRVQVAQFEPKEADVSISFTVSETDADNAEAIITHARNTAVNLVEEILTKQGTIGKIGRPPGSPNKPRGVSVAEARAAQKRAANTLAPEAESVMVAGSQFDTEDAVEDVGTNETVDEDPMDMDITAAAETPITDKDLNEKLMEKNAILKNPVRLRELVGRYVPPPGMARDIPQEQRKAFLLELEALK